MEKRAFLYQMPYLAILGFLALFFWTFKLEYIGIPLFMLWFVVLLVTKEDSTPSIPVLFASLFMISQTEWSFSQIPLYLYLTPVMILIGFFIHIIKYKVRLFYGKLLFGLSLFLVAMLLSTINASYVDFYYVFYVFIGFVYVLVYLFYRNTVEANKLHYLIQTMLVMGSLISLEVFIYYLRVPSILEAIEQKTINLGWGVSNFVATYLILFIPATFYYAKISKTNFSWLFLGIFQIVMLLFTLSRGGILTFVIVFAFLLFYLFKSKYWKTTFFNFVAIILIFSILLYSNIGLFEAIFSRFRMLFFDTSGRINIYVDALRTFIRNPLFGAGIFSRIDQLGAFRMYHNTILHTLASFGIVGFIALCILVVASFKVVLYQNKPKTIVLGIALLGANIHGLIDNVFYMPQFMILFLVILAVIEQSNHHYDYYMKSEIEVRL
jgi:O-antigen ligase